ncbi:isochorismatase family protein [Rhodococcus chondri]|uniref:Isochorismatase family protein n=1 Tax=Rhodococcus chondri TaxID=3065941 RepID=A0ABU7JYA4_9NOCA|nr:isochorismatase family protein [Rhodococcus sp. CC-R104]MEE2034998.1 isochorismatase family protein [Rhodococcus sp. CC-R104]
MTAPRRALVLVDVQNQYFEGPLAIQYPPRDQSLRNIVRLIDHADATDMPVVVVQHTLPQEAPLFADGSHTWELHPDVAARIQPSWKLVRKNVGSAFGGTDVAQWLREQNVDTITLAGYMTNNCNLATAADAEVRGLAAEVISDATGAIHIANAAGKASAEQVHNTLMAIFNSNFAAVATADDWIDANTAGAALEKDNLVTSAVEGQAAFGA